MNTKRQIFCLTAIALTGLLLQSQTANAALAGKVQFANGNVKLTTAEGATKSVRKGDAVNEGDSITTAVYSSVQIKMLDGGMVAVRPDTKMKFDQFVFTGKQDGSERGFFTLVKGGFRAVTGLVGQVNKKNYRITTPTATIGIRGTDHETFVVAEGTGTAEAGAYSKVNVGETTLTTNKGTLNVLPNQMGFAGGLNELPKLSPINTNIFTVSAAPTKTIKQNKEDKQEAKKESKQDSKQESKKEGKQESKQESKQEAKQEAKQESKQEATSSSEGGATGGGAEVAPMRSEAAADSPANVGGSSGSGSGIAAPAAARPAAATSMPVANVEMKDNSGNTLDAANQSITASTGAAATVADVVVAIANNPNSTFDSVVSIASKPDPVSNTIAYLLANLNRLAAAEVTVTDAASVSELATLKSQVGNKGSLSWSAVKDTAANLNSNAGNFVVAGKDVTVTDTPTIAQLVSIDAKNGAAALNYTSISDKWANLSANSGRYVTSGKIITVTDVVSLAQLTTLQSNIPGITLKATSINDVVSLLISSAYVQPGVNVGVTDVANLQQLSVIDNANAAGTLSYTSVTDTAAALNGSVYVVPGINVTVTGAASLAQLATLAGKISGGNLIHSEVIDTIANIAADKSGFIKPGMNVTVTDAANISQLSAITAKIRLGVLSVGAIIDTAANVAASSYVKPNVNVTLTDVATIQELTAIAAKNTGGLVNYSGVSDTTANLINNFGNFVLPGKTINVSDAASLAQLAALDQTNGTAALTFTQVNDTHAQHGIYFVSSLVGGGVNEGLVSGAYNAVTPTNTVFEFDANRNLQRVIGTSYSTFDQTSLVDSIANANIVFSGGTAADRFSAADNSILMGRWQGGSMTVSDATATVAPITVAAGASSTHWIVAQMFPEISAGITAVQNMGGTSNYSLLWATHPTDNFGNVGSVTAATLSADFTAQTVATTAQFTFSKNDSVNLSSKNMVFDINQPSMPIVGSSFSNAWPSTTSSVTCSSISVVSDCTAGTWSAWLSGAFIGTSGKTAYVVYTWYNSPTSTPTTGTSYTDMVRSIVAFNTATAPATASPQAVAITTQDALNVGLLTNKTFTTMPANVGTGAAIPNFKFDWGNGNTTTLVTLDAAAGGLGAVNGRATSVVTTGIQFGRYTNVATVTQADTISGITNSFAINNVGERFHWISGPSAPTYLVQSLLGTASYVLDGGTSPTYSSQILNGGSGSSGTGVLTSASLAVDFTKQAVGINLAVSAGSHNWVVSTPSGSEAPLGNSNGNASSAFMASSALTGPGALSVMLDGVAVTGSSILASSIVGQLTGATLNGALFQFQLAGMSSAAPVPVLPATMVAADSVAKSAQSVMLTGPAITGGTPGITFPAGPIGTLVMQPATTVSLTTVDGINPSSVVTTGGVAINVSTLVATGVNTYTGVDSNSGQSVSLEMYSQANTGVAGGLVYSNYGWLGKHPAIPALAPATSTGVFTDIYFAGGSLITPAEGMPKAINATYTGFMQGAAQDSSDIAKNAYYLLSGVASLSADFTNGLLTGSMTGISTTDAATQLAAGLFNDLSLNGVITSASSGFSGTVTAGAAPVVNASPIALANGAISTGTTSGHFYGPNANELTGIWALSSGTISASASFGAGNGTSGNAGNTLETVNGVVAMTQTSVNGVNGAAINTAPTANLVFGTYFDSASISQVNGGMNNSTRIVTDATGAVTGFDVAWTNNLQNTIAASRSVTIGTAVAVDTGTDAVSGIRWGRWNGGTLQYTNRVTQAVTAEANTNLHWIAGPTTTSVTLPVSGTYDYVFAGGTSPTDNLGNSGTLNGATLHADLNVQTVNVGVDATVNATNYLATGTGLPIQQAKFGFNTGGTSTFSASGTAIQGVLGGAFTGATGEGAAVVYGFQNGTTSVNGVAAFHR